MLRSDFTRTALRGAIPFLFILPLTAQVSSGHRLFSPKAGTDTFLADNQGQVVHVWPTGSAIGNTVYMAENGNLLRTRQTAFLFGGSGGGLQEFDFDGNLLWDFHYDTGGNLAHHDIEILPNGNVLMLAWETFTAQEALDAGRNPAFIGSSFAPDHIIEVEKTGPTTGSIVWEWHVWDHLVQDFDMTKANFGDVAAARGLHDINYPPGVAVDFNHANSIDYDPVNDWILFSANAQDEIWIIDHSTTTAEAAGHTGGDRGKGGDILYRWGNPEAYRAGTSADQKLFVQHYAKFIPAGLPGGGNITLFNNQILPTSTVTELVLPLDVSNNIIEPAPGGTFGPAAPLWTYSDPALQSNIMSSVERLPNGNTLITSTLQGRIFEIQPDGTNLWEIAVTSGVGGVFHTTYVERTLWQDVDEVSASAGGTVEFDLVGGTAFAGERYMLVGSFSGTSPGFTYRGVHVPLNLDMYFKFTVSNANSTSFPNSFGTVDATGNASTSVVIPPGEALGLVGLEFQHLIVTLPTTTFDLLAVSNVETFTIVP